jgi:hypothetical protein
MKKYLAGVLIVAALAVIAGVHFSSLKNAHAAPTCNGYEPYKVTISTNPTRCATTYCSQGVQYTAGNYDCGASISGNPPVGTVAGTYMLGGDPTLGSNLSALSSIMINGGGFTSALYSLFYSNAISWVNTNGNKVAPKSVSTRVNFFDQNNTPIYLIGGDMTKAASLVDNLAGRMISSGGPAFAPVACNANNINAVSGNFKCCRNGGLIGWTTNSSSLTDAICSAAITTGNSNVYIPAQ